ncbi:LytTR family DNA-binding domain-containing protein [Halalkalibacter oceani]|uniref:LytTR family transcriptional regulator n=1 Tax=Halalkalibacter oceani TaxID=1653776 RepID=A0A9X2DMA9_9BACI|nr:LytTR family DNA-binding domain-containing protein [Halalkalibacter oceani]MCM3713396.1 LytTR family transcriptional regulator [Halalkalibacter oceani]
MKVHLDINDSYQETVITIQCKEADQMILDLLHDIKRREAPFIVGQQGEMQHLLKPESIHLFRVQHESVHAITAEGAFKVKEKLYELEEQLPSGKFVRLSKSVIANLYELSHFEASFHGTLRVYFHSGETEYVSRHYVNGIKEALKLNRRKS